MAAAGFQVMGKGCRNIIIIIIIAMMLLVVQHFQLEKDLTVKCGQELSEIKQLNITLSEKYQEISEKNKEILTVQSNLEKLQVENQEKSSQLIEIQAKYNQTLSLSHSDHLKLQNLTLLMNNEVSQQALEKTHVRNLLKRIFPSIKLDESLDNAAFVNAFEIKSKQVVNDSSLSEEPNVVENVVEVGNQSFKVLNLRDYKTNVYQSTISTIVNSTNQFVFKSYNLNKPPIFNLHDEANHSFLNIDKGVSCFIKGTDIQNSHRKCKCKAEYFGEDCGIPAAAWFSYFQNEGSIVKLRRRATPRRVIHGMQVNHELVMFKTRLHELYNVVDVFIIVEANHTDYGDPKPLVFLDRLKNGYLKEYQDKIVHVFVDSEPPDAKENSWRAHNYMRSFLGPQSLSRINGIRDDDLFIVSDADEIPTREIVTFLKLYDGYYEHVCFRYRWNVYGFFWKAENNKMTEVCSVSSIKILRDHFGSNTWMIRSQREISTWWAGTLNHYAGWHCSWCFSPEGIVLKLDAAQAADRPRWGDYPEKKNITYIKSLIRKGRWFDDQGRFDPAQMTESMYAPSYLIKHLDKYKTLLLHPKNRPKIS